MISNKVNWTNLFWTVMCMFMAVFVYMFYKRMVLLTYTGWSSWLSSHVNKKYLLNFERQFSNVKEERYMCVYNGGGSRRREYICVALKNKFVFFLLELESVQLLMRVVHLIYVFMIRTQSTFNDLKDCTKLSFIFEGQTFRGCNISGR